MSSIFAKIKDFFAKNDYISLLFILLSLKMTIFSTTIGDALIILAFLGHISYSKWLETQKAKTIELDFKKELEDVKNIVSAIGLKSPKIPQQPEIKRFF